MTLAFFFFSLRSHCSMATVSREETPLLSTILLQAALVPLVAQLDRIGRM